MVPLHKYNNDKDNYDKSMKTTSGREILNKLVKDTKKILRAFTTVNSQLQILKDTDSELYEYED